MQTDWLLIPFIYCNQLSSWQTSESQFSNAGVSHSRNSPQDKPSTSKVEGRTRPLQTHWDAGAEIKNCIKRAGKSLMEAESGPREAAVSLCQTPSTRNQNTYTSSTVNSQQEFQRLGSSSSYREKKKKPGVKHSGLSSLLQGPSIHIESRGLTEVKNPLRLPNTAKNTHKLQLFAHASDIQY